MAIIRKRYTAPSEVPIIDLGTLTEATAINYSDSSRVQTLTIDGVTVELTEGIGWPSDGYLVDLLLIITLLNDGAITWTLLDSTFPWLGSEPTFDNNTHQVVLRQLDFQVGGPSIHGIVNPFVAGS